MIQKSIYIYNNIMNRIEDKIPDENEIKGINETVYVK